jgi:aryl sulfotransferase
MNGIVWIASYPKSGNTWLRIFLAQLVGEREYRLNEFGDVIDDGLGIASERQVFDAVAGVDASDLLPDEIDRLRPRVYEAVAAASTRTAFVKVHDAWLATPSGEPLLPPCATKCAIYVVRNPLDVAVSFAFHSGTSFDRIIACMADPEFTIGYEARRLRIQLRQRLSSWSGHIASWLDAPGIDRLVLRYEDMASRPLETFGAAARFLGHDSGRDSLLRAIEAASFSRLQSEERERGFVEKPHKAERFFREGRVGGWRDHLSREQAARIVADHETAMRRLGYIDGDGRLRH